MEYTTLKIMLEAASDPETVGSWDPYIVANLCSAALKYLRQHEDEAKKQHIIKLG